MTATTYETPPDQWRTGGPGGKQRMIPHPTSGDLRPYTRVTTLAKALDDKEGLMAWKAWMAVRGSRADPALAEQALHAQRTPRGVIEALAEAGGAGEKRDRGKARHEILAMALRGADTTALPHQARAELSAILQLVASLGVVQAVEAPLVCDELQVAGTADLILKGPDGGTVVADLKTGSDQRLSTAIQLVCYARSHFWDFDTESRLSLVSPQAPRLVVIHAPQDGTPPRLIDIDPAQALAWARLAYAVREARRQASALERTTA